MSFFNKKMTVKTKLILVALSIIFIIICLFLGSLEGYLWTLPVNRFWSVVLFVFAAFGLIYGVNNRAQNKTSQYIIFLLLAASIVFFVNIFYPLLR